MNSEFKKACEFVEMLNEKYGGLGYAVHYQEKDWTDFVVVYGFLVEGTSINIGYDNDGAEEGVDSIWVDETDFLDNYVTFEDFKKCFKVFEVIKKEIKL